MMYRVKYTISGIEYTIKVSAINEKQAELKIITCFPKATNVQADSEGPILSYLHFSI